MSQGEREMMVDNKMLGAFNLEGIPPAPRGIPQIEVTFDIDASGILSVSAKDKGTGKEQKITIKSDGGLSQDEIDKMVKEAEANKEADKKRRDEVDSRNQADSILHEVDKNLKEHGEKISAEDKDNIIKAKEALQESLKGKDAEDIKKKVSDLVSASMKLGEAVSVSYTHLTLPTNREV